MNKDNFKKSLSSRAKLYLPGNPKFESAKKVWNHYHDYVNPAMVVKVGGVADIQQCLEYAKQGNIFYVLPLNLL